MLFFGGMDAVGGPMLKQVKQLGLNVKFMGGDGLCTGELPKLAGDAIGEDMVVCAEAGGVTATSSSRWKTSTAKFKTKNGVDVQIYAPHVVRRGQRAGQAMKARPVRPILRGTCPKWAIQYKGVTGRIAFDEKGDIKGGALTLYTYKGGQRTQIAVAR